MTDGFQPFVLKNTSHRQFSMPTLNRLSWVREEQEYTSLGTRFEQLASGHGSGMRSADFWGSLLFMGLGACLSVPRSVFVTVRTLAPRPFSSLFPFIQQLWNDAQGDFWGDNYIVVSTKLPAVSNLVWWQSWIPVMESSLWNTDGNTPERPAEGSVLDVVTVV